MKQKELNDKGEFIPTLDALVNSVDTESLSDSELLEVRTLLKKVSDRINNLLLQRGVPLSEKER